MTDSYDFLATPLPVTLGQPLRVAVYSRLSEAIHDGRLPLGAMFPKERELCEKMGVSRTVIREALMLLEEDGLLITRRGIGRFVTRSLPSPGLENILPPEKILSGHSGKITLKRIETHLQKPSDFTHEFMGISKDDDAWFCESLVYSDEKVIALIQEHLPAGNRLDEIDRRIANEITPSKNNHQSIHAVVQQIMGNVLGPGLSSLTAGIPGTDRGSKMGLSRSAPVLILTQAFMYNASPFYLAKIIINAGVQIKVNQAVQSA